MPDRSRPTAADLLWRERPAPRRGPRPTLSTEVIARAGIELADAEGLAAVTMQRVADAVGVTKMALYRYVPGKVELVALMIDLGLAAPPDLAEVPGGWRPRLDVWARRMFETFRAHPWAMDATVGTRVMGPNEVGWLEQAVGALAGTPLDATEKLDVAVLLIGHARHLAQQTAATPTTSAEQSLDAVYAALVQGREDRYPALAEALADIPQNGGQDQALDFGLARILAGVEQLIDDRSGRG